jgi:hypothetical protein
LPEVQKRALRAQAIVYHRTRRDAVIKEFLKEKYMANWKYKLDISFAFADCDLPIEERAERVAVVIRKRLPEAFFDFSCDQYDSEIDMIADEFEGARSVEDFDCALEMLYDWGDLEVEPFDVWPANKMCWVETHNR